jgi:hypothetical protein
VNLKDVFVEFGTADVVFSSVNGAELNIMNLSVFLVNATALIAINNIEAPELSPATIDLALIEASSIDVSCDSVFGMVGEFDSRQGRI